MAGSVGQPTQTWFPWVGAKANTTWGDSASNHVNNNGHLGMGYSITNGSVQNSTRSWDVYLDSVVWKITTVYGTAPFCGIQDYQFNGVSQGTNDSYAAAGTNNNYVEKTGLSVATPGIVTFQVIMTTKNASSSGYDAVVNSLALIATSGAYSTPSGSDTPGYTWEWIPWMGFKAFSGSTAVRSQGSGQLGGGYLSGTNAQPQNEEVDTDVWLDSGTFTYAQVVAFASDQGIYTINLDGVSKGTLDPYNVATTFNNYQSVTSIALTAPTSPRNFQLKMATKNASSTSYGMAVQSAKWIRTGA